MKKYKKRDIEELVFFPEQRSGIIICGYIDMIMDTHGQETYRIKCKDTQYGRITIEAEKCFDNESDAKKELKRLYNKEKREIKKKITSEDDLITFMLNCIEKSNVSKASKDAIKELIKELK